ncbi:MAG: hypothetical protein ACI9VR_003741 [Cognaticolwellia sp.]|jgi:hypothetical protein
MNLDPATADLLFTVIASSSLLGLWGLSALVLPWRQKELDQVQAEIHSLTAKETMAPHAALLDSAHRRAA